MIYEKLLNAAFRFVSYRPRSEKEVRDFLRKKLTQWKISATLTTDKVIERLREYGYLDDKKFTSWWIEQRNTFKPKGQRLLKQELLHKGISRALIDEELAFGSDNVNSDRRQNRLLLSEKELARQAVQKKLDRWRILPTIDRKKKVFGFLTRRGFSSDTISGVIDELS